MNALHIRMFGRAYERIYAFIHHSWRHSVFGYACGNWVFLSSNPWHEFAPDRSFSGLNPEYRCIRTSRALNHASAFPTRMALQWQAFRVRALRDLFLQECAWFWKPCWSWIAPTKRLRSHNLLANPRVH